MQAHSSPTVELVDVSAYTVPTQTPEADGTLSWNETTLVLVRTSASGEIGMGYSFADIATAKLIDAHLKHVVCGHNCLNIPGIWCAMVRLIGTSDAPASVRWPFRRSTTPCGI